MENSQSNSLTITLAVTTGLADVYVRNDDNTPTPSFSTWSTQQPSPVRGQIVIPNPILTTYRLVVACSGSTDSTYSLSYSLAQTPLLASGQAITSHVAAGSYARYRFSVDSSTQVVNLLLNNLGSSGSLHLYMNVGMDAQQGQSTWDTDQLSYTISASSSPALTSGMLHIAVLGVADTAFSLTITTRTTVLTFGVPVTLTASASGNFFYFPTDASLENRRDTTLQFKFNDGNSVTAALYFGNNETNPEPTVANSLWVGSVGTENNNMWTIARNDEHFCQVCSGGCTCSVIFVGVFVSTPGSVFTVLASSGQVLNQLASSVDMPTSYVPLQDYRFYSLTFPTSSSYLAFLEPCTGDADLFADTVYNPADPTAPSPTSKHNSWKSENRDAMDILRFDSPATSSAVYLGVAGISSPYLQYSNFILHTRSVDEYLTYPKVTSGAITSTPVDGKDGSITVSFQLINMAPSAFEYTLFFAPTSDNAGTYTIEKVELALVDRTSMC